MPATDFDQPLYPVPAYFDEVGDLWIQVGMSTNRAIPEGIQTVGYMFANQFDSSSYAATYINLSAYIREQGREKRYAKAGQ